MDHNLRNGHHALLKKLAIETNNPLGNSFQR